MLKPPFNCRLSLPPESPHLPPVENNQSPPDLDRSTSPRKPHHTLPVVFRSGPTLTLTQSNISTFFMSELQTPRLNIIASYLWLAGSPGCARALHRQILLGREILVTEDPNEHLVWHVWHESRIFVKPLPAFLFQIECWEDILCKERGLFVAACSFLLSYAWLVRYESDLRIAHEKGLLPESITWESWTSFLNDFLQYIDLTCRAGISPRFQYGELRLSRLNKIYRLTSFSWEEIVRGYMTFSTWYKDFFAKNFAWLLAVFATIEVRLSAMQVVASLGDGGTSFERMSYGFAVTSLFVAAVSVAIVIGVWGVLFVHHLTYAYLIKRRVEKEGQLS
jgi:hypothetical protein